MASVPQLIVDLLETNDRPGDELGKHRNVTGEVQCDSLDVDGSADFTGAVTLHNNLDLQDDDKILLGASDDLQLFHSTNSHIDNYAGELAIRNFADDFDITALIN